MASPNDDFSLKDALSVTFKYKSKDISNAQDGSKQIARHYNTPYPVEYGIGGCFQITSKSGVMAAGLAAGSPIYSFRWTSTTMLAILRRIRLQAWTLGTAFTAGIASFDVFVCRSWTVADTGGVVDTISGDNGNLRTAMPGSLVSELRHSSTATLTAGTRAKDAQPLDSASFGIAATVTNQLWTPTPMKLFERLDAEHPLVMAQNEGFTIQATVPATGTWAWSITPEWDEVPVTAY